MISVMGGKRWFLEVAESFQNLPYLWGGDDPMSGFDCSGMVVESLKSIGAIDIHRDFSADGLWHRFHGPFEVEKPSRGCMAFWFNEAGRAIHVAVCLSDEVCLTADRGGRTILNLTDAHEKNAFIKVRPIDHRKAKPRFIDIFQGD